MNWIVSLWVMRDNPGDKAIPQRCSVHLEAYENYQVTFGTCLTTAPSASLTKSFHVYVMFNFRLKRNLK